MKCSSSTIINLMKLATDELVRITDCGGRRVRQPVPSIVRFSLIDSTVTPTSASARADLDLDLWVAPTLTRVACRRAARVRDAAGAHRSRLESLQRHLHAVSEQGAPAARHRQLDRQRPLHPDAQAHPALPLSLRESDILRFLYLYVSPTSWGSGNSTWVQPTLRFLYLYVSPTSWSSSISMWVQPTFLGSSISTWVQHLPSLCESNILRFLYLYMSPTNVLSLLSLRESNILRFLFDSDQKWS